MAEEFLNQSRTSTALKLKSFVFKKLGSSKLPIAEQKTAYCRVRRIVAKQNAGGNGISHGNQLFSEAQESGILAFVLSLTINKVPIKPEQVRRLVKEQFGKENHWNGKKWWRLFKTRHSKAISTGLATKSITAARLNNGSILPEVKNWCVDYQGWINNLKLQASDVYNMDETLCKIDSTKGTNGLITAAGADLNNIEFPRTSTIGCQVHFICADGRRCPSFNIRKEGEVKNGEMDVMETANPTRANPGLGMVYLKNATGMLNRDAMGSIIHHFVSWRRSFAPGKDCIVLLDNARCHLNEEAILEAWKYGIHFVFFPANCTR